MNKKISGKKIHKIGKRFGHKKLIKIFSKDKNYNYEEFKEYMLRNMDNYQSGGGLPSVNKVLRDIFNGILNNKYKTEPQEKSNILPDKLSEVQIAYKKLKDSMF